MAVCEWKEEMSTKEMRKQLEEVSVARSGEPRTKFEERSDELV